MASPLSPLLFPATGQTQEPAKPHLKSESPNPPNPWTKKPKGRPRKKIPQRGMGVEKLERYLMEMKQTSENNQLQSVTPPQPETKPDLLLNSVPVHYGAMNFTGPVVNRGGFLGWEQGLGLGMKRAETNGGGGVGSGQVLVNPYMVGNPVQVGNGRAVFETPKELSSIPKMVMMMQQHESTRCDYCVKKKRLTGDQNIGYNGRRQNLSEISPINPEQYLGMNLGNNMINFNGDITGFSSKPARNSTTAFYANQNFTKGVDVLAVHRKGKSAVDHHRGVFMEYEFFPGGKTSEEWGKMGTPEGSFGALGSGGGEAASSCVTSCDQNGYYSASNASNSIDLSLKLSY